VAQFAVTQLPTCTRRIGSATAVARNLKDIWNAKDISKDTKVLVYRSLVQSILLYNAETWTLKDANKRSLRVFEMPVVREILGLTKRDHIRNEDIPKKLAIDKDIVEILRTRRLSYFGHVVRMDCHRYLHILLHGYVRVARARGRPGKKWIDNIKEIVTFYSSYRWMPTDSVKTEPADDH